MTITIGKLSYTTLVNNNLLMLIEINTEKARDLIVIVFSFSLSLLSSKHPSFLLELRSLLRVHGIFCKCM